MWACSFFLLVFADYPVVLVTCALWDEMIMSQSLSCCMEPHTGCRAVPWGLDEEEMGSDLASGWERLISHGHHHCRAVLRGLSDRKDPLRPLGNLDAAVHSEPFASVSSSDGVASAL